MTDWLCGKTIKPKGAPAAKARAPTPAASAEYVPLSTVDDQGAPIDKASASGPLSLPQQNAVLRISAWIAGDLRLKTAVIILMLWLANLLYPG